MNKVGIVEIRKIAFTKLRKLEVYSFYNEVVRVVGRYDTKAMHIGDTCDVLMIKQPKTELLKLSDRDHGPHLLTPEVNRLHKTRLKFAAIITNQMRIVEKAGLADNLYAVELAKPIVYGHLNYLRQNDISAIGSAINGFFYILHLQPEVKDALYELGFKTYLNELEDANREHETTYAERSAQLSQRPKGSTIPVQRELQYILSILFEQVDYYQHVYRDVDYSGLITALNHVIAVYTKLIKTRDTQRKNKKLNAKDDAQDALKEQLGEEGVEKEQSALAANHLQAKATTDIKENQKKSPAASKNMTRRKEKPIIGLLDILKKPDKGKRNKENDGNLPPTNGD